MDYDVILSERVLDNPAIGESWEMVVVQRQFDSIAGIDSLQLDEFGDESTNLHRTATRPDRVASADVGRR